MQVITKQGLMALIYKAIKDDYTLLAAIAEKACRKEDHHCRIGYLGDDNFVMDSMEGFDKTNGTR